MTVTLEALQLVDAIERRGSFAGAAEELGRVPVGGHLCGAPARR